MKCEFDYCIYNQDSACLLEEIEINSIGLCEDCIIVSVPENELESYKKTQLKEVASHC